jgi:hypothetical protein
MFRLIDFMNLFKQDDVDFKEMARKKEQYTGTIKAAIEEYELGVKRTKAKYSYELMKNIKNSIEGKVITELMTRHRDQKISGFYSFIRQYGRYPQLNFLNKNLVEDLKNTYVMPMFLKPGR